MNTRSILFLLFTLFNAGLLLSGKIVFYIHPRFVWLTICMLFVSIAVIVFEIATKYDESLIKKLRAILSHGKTRIFLVVLLLSLFFPIPLAPTLFVLSVILWGNTILHAIVSLHTGEVVFCGIILLGLFLNPAVLSSVTAKQRATSLNDIRITQKTDEVQTLGDVPDEEKTLYDWQYFMSFHEKTVFVNRKVKLMGFIYRYDNLPPNYAYVGRFMVTCCAVDATPTGLLVKFDAPTYKEDEWVSLTGEFTIEQINERDEIVIVPTEIIRMGVPENPYIF